MEENKNVSPLMEEKTVKFEIGKLLAIVITVVVIAGVASAFLSSNYYKGMIGEIKLGALTEQEYEMLLKDCSSFTKEDLLKMSELLELTEQESELIKACYIEVEDGTSSNATSTSTSTTTDIKNALTEQQIELLNKECSAFTKDELEAMQALPGLTEQEQELIKNCLDPLLMGAAPEGEIYTVDPGQEMVVEPGTYTVTPSGTEDVVVEPGTFSVTPSGTENVVVEPGTYTVTPSGTEDVVVEPGTYTVTPSGTTENTKDTEIPLEMNTDIGDNTASTTDESGAKP